MSKQQSKAQITSRVWVDLFVNYWCYNRKDIMPC